jgi:YD repeat-containing protein
LYKIIDAMSYGSVKNIYNPDGTLYSKSDARGNTTIYEYDDHIRLKKTTYPDPTKYEELSYDDAGRLEEKRTRANETITYYYDELNRLKTKAVTGVPERSITYEYDLLSRQINIIDTISSNTIQNDFDNVGRLKSVTYDYYDDYPFLDDKIVQYEYDAAGNRKELMYPDDGKYVRYNYDKLNRLVSIRSDCIIGYWNFDEGEGDIAHDEVGANNGNIENGALWTSSGKIDSALDFAGNSGYVDLGQDTWSASELAKGTISAWVKIPDITTPMTDNGHSIVNVEACALRFNGLTDKFRFTLYDGVSVHGKDGTTTPQNNMWYLVSMTWDGETTVLYVNGNPENSDPTGSPDCDSSSRNGYIGANWNLTSFFDGIIDEVMIFDRALQQEEIEAIYDGTNQDEMIARYEYDALSSRVSARYGNDTSAEYNYDMADRLLALNNQTNSENLSYDYSYDNVGNRLTMLVNGTDLHNYTYDNIYQLTEVDYPEDSFTDDTSFVYDPAGNRWQVTGSGLGPYYATNILNQYTSAGTVYFSYDDNGNLTGDGTDSYTYDAENRLMTANASGLSVTYNYGPSGRRISKTIGGETTYYIYDGDQAICEYDDAGILRKKFVYGVGIDEVVRMSQVGRTADISGPSGPPDDIVDIYDLRKMSEAWLNNEGDASFNADADLNYDGKINNFLLSL